MTAIDPTSTFPTTVDTFPTIVQNDDEAAAGKEHWLLHNKQSNAIRSAQTRILSLVSQGLASQWRNGTGAPSNGLGVDGDYYVNTTTGAGAGDVYFRASGTYSVVINLKGPQGIQGIQGPTGAQWRNGVGVPANSLGVDGDFYLNSTSGAGAGDVYKRTSGTYSIVANITGATTIPTGGTTGQLVAKASNADFDITFVNSAALSNATPLIAAGAGASGSGITAARADHVHPSELTNLTKLVGPTGMVAQTFDSVNGSDNAGHALNGTGSLYMVAIPIPKNVVVTTINMQVFAAAVTPAHQWAGLFDSGPAALVLTADHTTTAYAAGTTMSMDLTTPYTTGASDALYYIGILVTAGTMPTFTGRTITGARSGTTGPVLPKLVGNGATGLTTPPSLPYDVSATKATWGANTSYVWVWLT